MTQTTAYKHIVINEGGATLISHEQEVHRVGRLEGGRVNCAVQAFPLCADLHVGLVDAVGRSAHLMVKTQ